jgi:hypothetical protein
MRCNLRRRRTPRATHARPCSGWLQAGARPRKHTPCALRICPRSRADLRRVESAHEDRYGTRRPARHGTCQRRVQVLSAARHTCARELRAWPRTRHADSSRARRRSRCRRSDDPDSPGAVRRKGLGVIPEAALVLPDLRAPQPHEEVTVTAHVDVELAQRQLDLKIGVVVAGESDGISAKEARECAGDIRFWFCALLCRWPKCGALETYRLIGSSDYAGRRGGPSRRCVPTWPRNPVRSMLH